MLITMPFQDMKNLYRGLHVVFEVVSRDEDGEPYMVAPLGTATSHNTGQRLKLVKEANDPDKEYSLVYCVRQPSPERDKRRTTSEMIVNLKKQNGGDK